MAKSLLIVESPAKASTLKKFLGSDFTVKASMGHVKDLPKSKLGVDIENKFTPSYEVIRKKAKVLKELKEAAKNATAVYLAPDPDREGEAIAWHIAEEIDEGKAEVYRVAFEKEKELTDRALKLAEVGKPKSNLQLQGILGLAVFALGFLMGK
jgi:DNA topoisomerase-1